MERFVVIGALILFLAVQNGFAEDQANEDGSVIVAPKKKYEQLWFGPRLGRRKRTPEGYITNNIDRQQIDTLMDLIHDSPWAIVAVDGNENKRYDASFVPRLGRESEEEMLIGTPSETSPQRLLQEPEFIGEMMSQRSPPFAPRLGKRVLSFAPRLGKRVLSFAPRLGKRVLSFAPRLGRENFQPDRVA